jgi:chemotaxis protein MotB
VARVIIKKKKGDHGHHGGAWKVAYADFVTAMMALFMVLWLLSQTDQEARQKLSEYFRTGVFSGAPSVLMGGSGLQELGFLDTEGKLAKAINERDLYGTAKEIEKAIQQSDDARLIELIDRVQIKLVDQGLLIQILDDREDLLFDRSSSQLKEPLVALLQVLAPVFARIPNKLEIHGHTDAKPFPFNSSKDNWKLSFERANNARTVLSDTGVRAGQIVGVFAHADNSPIDPKDPYAESNRRLAILALRLDDKKPQETRNNDVAPEAPGSDDKVEERRSADSPDAGPE